MEYIWDMSKQILVVDDEVQILALLSVMFRRVGYLVIKAENAHKALRMLDTSTPDLFILDVMMPEIDGIELCRRIRARPETARTPVILFSAYDDPIMMQRGLEAGANEFLTKITAHAELVKRVRNMLDENSSNPA
jgi:two-component system phosphate regulon response regulator PhoB